MKYTVYDRIADTMCMDNTDNNALWTSVEVITMMAVQCEDFERYTIEVNCEAIVLWLDGKIATLALNDNEESDISDAEDYLRNHEEV